MKRGRLALFTTLILGLTAFLVAPHATGCIFTAGSTACVGLQCITTNRHITSA